MGSFHYVIKDEIGIHARPAGMLAKMAKGFDSAVTITKGEKTVDASKLMAVMGLGVKKCDEIVISTDNTEDLEILKKFFEENLYIKAQSIGKRKESYHGAVYRKINL